MVRESYAATRTASVTDVTGCGDAQQARQTPMATRVCDQTRYVGSEDIGLGDTATSTFGVREPGGVGEPGLEPDRPVRLVLPADIINADPGTLAIEIEVPVRERD